MNHTIPITGEYNVYTHTGAFASGLAALRKQGLELVTAAEFANLRMQAGTSHDMSTHFSWVAESYVYLPSGDVLLTSKEQSPILREQSLDASCRVDYIGQRGGSHPSGAMGRVVKLLWDRARTDPDEAIDTGVLRLPPGKVREHLSMKRKGKDNLFDEPVFRFLFRENALAYGRWLAATGNIVGGPVHSIARPPTHDRPFALQAYLANSVYGNHWLSDPEGRVTAATYREHLPSEALSGRREQESVAHPG